MFDAKAYNKAYYVKHRQRINENKRQFRKNNPEIVRDRWLRSEYGISATDYDRFYEEQDGKCAICRTPQAECSEGKLAVDHCHMTGGVRGLLCKTCNQGIGLLKDNPVLLEAAAGYLTNRKQING